MAARATFPTEFGYSSGGPDVTEDGRYVVFGSSATNMIQDYDPRCHYREEPALTVCNELYVRDMWMGVTAIVSQNADGEPDNGSPALASFSGDGRTVVFASGATNLHPSDTGPVCDVDTIFACGDVYLSFAVHYQLADLNCDGIVDGLDALVLGVFKAGPQPEQYAWCPMIDTMTGFPSGTGPQGGVLRLFGDVDCNHVVELLDMIKILRFYAWLPVEQEGGCPQMGELPPSGTPVPSQTGAPSATPTPTPTPTGTPPGSTSATPTASPSKTPSPTPSPTAGPPPNECPDGESYEIANGDGGYVYYTFDFGNLDHEIVFMALCVNLDHEHVGELVLTLKHESTGTQVDLTRRVGNPDFAGNCTGAGQGLYVLYDDLEDKTLHEQCTNNTTSQFIGAFLPDEALSAFNGETIGGIWTLVITDEVPGPNTGVALGSFLYYEYNP